MYLSSCFSFSFLFCFFLSQTQASFLFFENNFNMNTNFNNNIKQTQNKCNKFISARTSTPTTQVKWHVKHLSNANLSRKKQPPTTTPTYKKNIYMHKQLFHQKTYY